MNIASQTPSAAISGLVASPTKTSAPMPWSPAVSSEMAAGVPGCLNLRYLQAALQRAREQHVELTVLLLDLDNFKRVVEVRGHLPASNMIDRVGKRIARAVKDMGRVVHWGGDEFVVLLGRINPEDAEALARHLRGWVACELATGARHLSASVGISSGPADIGLLPRAEQALRVAKAAGRGTAMVLPSAEPAPPCDHLPVAHDTVLASAPQRDPLTHLFTRPRLWHDLRTALHASTHSVAVAMWDLDKFRDINASHGFATGSHVLQAVAGALAAQVGARSPTYRFGGDEFCTIFTGQAAREAAYTCRAARHHIQKQTHWGGIACRLSLQFGLARRAHSATTPRALLQEADTFLLQAKSAPN